MEHCVNDRSRLVGTVLAMLLIFFMSLFHIYLCCCIVRGGGGGLPCAICAARMRNVYVCRVRTRCVCEDLCFVFSDWAIASWVLGCAAIYRQNTGLPYTHISCTRSWHFSYFCSRSNAYLAQPLLPSCVVILVGIHFEFFACGNPLCNMFVHCVWIFNHHQLHNTLVVSRHSMTTMFLYMRSVQVQLVTLVLSIATHE